VTYDHAADLFWVGCEFRHTIYRYAGDGVPDGYLELPFARNWSKNGGVEAMARLDNGHFLLLRETGSEGYLIQGDPVVGARYRRFRARYPEGYSPTDMAQLPDGRVLIVLRRVVLANPVFEAMIAVADPGELGVEEEWPVTPRSCSRRNWSRARTGKPSPSNRAMMARLPCGWHRMTTARSCSAACLPSCASSPIRHHRKTGTKKGAGQKPQRPDSKRALMSWPALRLRPIRQQR